jgi:hypothetical protein
MCVLKDLIESIAEGETVKKEELARAIGDAVSEDEEVRREISLTEDMIFNLKLGDVEVGVQIEGKVLSIHEPFKGPDLSIEFPQKILSEMVSGKRDLVSLLMGGDIITWREGEPYDASKLNLLVPLMTSFARKLDLVV